MSQKFSVIVSDPPWSFSDKLSMSDVKRGAEANYNTMTIEEIKALPIKDIADPSGAILCLWVPSTLLQSGLDVMNAYGFSFRQVYVWVKIKKDPYKKLIKKSLVDAVEKIKTLSLKEMRKYCSSIFSGDVAKDILGFGLGRIFRQSHEICLIGINNTGIYKKLQNKSQRSVCLAENLKHSTKPEDLQDSLDLMFGEEVAKLELFARRLRPGWDCVGNEIGEKLDIRDSLKKLI